MKLKQLECFLGQLDGFENPDVSLEQYATTPHIAAQMLYAIHSSFEDISDRVVVDLGCGCGILSIGASLLGASFCVGIDVDAEALSICKRNVEETELENIDLLQHDVMKPLPLRLNNAFDTAIMNPPFGTKNNYGIDMAFVEKALSMAEVVYSLHKTSTIEFIERHFKKLGIAVKPVAKISFDIKRCYRFHKKSSVDVEVHLIRFSNK